MKKPNRMKRLWAKAFPAPGSPRKREREAGLTLVETIIVVAIIVAFAAGAMIMLGPVLFAGKDAAAKNQIATFVQALEVYNLQCGNYPTEEQGLAALVKKPTIEPSPEGWRGPYLSKSELPKDPWGTEYKYMLPGPEGMPYGIVSYGADGKEGGEGDAKDISSWQ